MELLALTGRVVLSLAVVLGVLWVVARYMRRGQARTQRGVAVEVLARQSLAQRSSVAVVKVGDRALVLGVTESRVELLTEQPVDSLLPAAADGVPDEMADGRDAERAGEPDDVPDADWPAGAGGEVPEEVVRRLRPTTLARPPRPTQQTPEGRGPLAGSALSPATWTKALDAVRELTVRK